MRFASLGSGSEGNGLVVEGRDGQGLSRVLLDCGFSLKESVRRLARLGLTPESLDAIVVTHEHGDHIGGVFRLAQRYSIPVWATHGTLSTFKAEEAGELDIHVCVSDVPFAIGGIEIHPYPVPHDAREPTQFVFSDGHVRLGVLTDAGRSTPHITRVLGGCKALVLECNHDRNLLKNSKYHYSLKQRIGGDYGHLANETAAEILGALDGSQLVRVIAAHLSQQNNTPALARAALAGVLGVRPVEIGIADQSEGFGWMTL